jgi:hypothetical protein
MRQPSYRHLTFFPSCGATFDNTNKPLRDRFRAIHMLLSSKKGMSALEVMPMMGFGSYKTAWQMCHKIRTALIKDIKQLGGVVEVVETFVGKNTYNKHGGSGPGSCGGLGSQKTSVVGTVRRNGNLVARVVDTVGAEVLTKFVRAAVSHKVSLLWLWFSTSAPRDLRKKPKSRYGWRFPIFLDVSPPGVRSAGRTSRIGRLTSWAHAIERPTSGLGVRFFCITMLTGQGRSLPGPLCRSSTAVITESYFE